MDELIFYGILGIIVFVVLPAIGNYNKKKNREKEDARIDFNEFDDIEKLKQQKIDDRLTMERESEMLDQVYNDAYFDAYQNVSLNSNYDMNLESDRDRFSSDVASMKSSSVNKILNSKYKNIPGKVYEKEILDGPVVSKLEENGYNFDVELFKKWSRQIFGCIKEGNEVQLKVVKNCISEELFNRLNRQMRQLKKDGLQFITEDLVIEKCNLYDYSRSMSNEEIQIMIKASMKEYILKKDTNEVVKGNKERANNKKILLTFVKRNSTEEEGMIHNCPNCGAETVQTEFGKCRYCNTLVLPIRYNWTLVKFETM